MTALSFEIEAECPWSGARAAKLSTLHGEVLTPVFMPVGTQGTVKALTWPQVESVGSQIVLANSYHLYLRPGHKLVAEAGGLHKFTGWQKPILTDSGGFQVFSLEQLRKIDDEGVKFRDHITGREHFIGPAKSMEIQNNLGADIIMAFDECVKNPCTFDEARSAMERTHRWLDVCIKEHQRPDEQALFGIVQGSIFEDLRRESAQIVTSFDLPGFAIGGVAVGEERSIIEKIVEFTTPLLPRNKPRYLMGVGTPWDILHSAFSGIDMFDCTIATRLARHGAAITNAGRLAVKNAQFRQNWGALDPSCDCYTCTHHSAAYLHHLFHSTEQSAGTLLALHNIHFLHKEASACRQAILDGVFKEYFEEKSSFLKKLRK